LTQQIPWYQVPAYILGTAWYGRFVEKASHGHSIRLSTRSCTRYHTRPLLNNRKEACIAPPVAKVVCPGYSDTGRLVSYRALRLEYYHHISKTIMETFLNDSMYPIPAMAINRLAWSQKLCSHALKF